MGVGAYGPKQVEATNDLAGTQILEAEEASVGACGPKREEATDDLEAMRTLGEEEMDVGSCGPNLKIGATRVSNWQISWCACCYTYATSLSWWCGQYSTMKP